MTETSVLDSLGLDSGEDLAVQSGAGGNQEAVSVAAGSGDAGERAGADEAAAGKQAGGDVQSEAAGGAKSEKHVPLAALQEAREANRALKAQIDELKAQPKLSAEDAELLKDLREQHKATKDALAEPKDFLEDPKGYVDEKVAAVAKENDKLKADKAARDEQEELGKTLNRLLDDVKTAETGFMATAPDYQDAVDHLRAVRTEQLKIMYPKANAAQINQQITREEIGAAAQILTAGGNPAEFAYNYAKTYGYKPKAAKTAETAGAAGGGADIDAAAAAAAAAAGTVKASKDAVRSMGSSGGGAGDPANDDDGGMPELNAAIAERFGKRK